MTETNSGKASPNPAALAIREKALRCGLWALEKKARGMTILHIGPLTTIAEYFVICSGRSLRQTGSIAGHIQARFKENGILPLGVEGLQESSWILLDYDDVVVHIFHEPTRELFSLEKLWSDAAPLTDPALQKEQDAVENRGAEEDDDWEL